MSGRTPTPRAEAARPQDHTRQQVYGYISERTKRWLGEDLKRTRAGLARKAGLRVEQIHEVLNGDRRPTERSMRAIARAVGVDFDELEVSAASWMQSAKSAAAPALPSAVKAPSRRTQSSSEKVGGGAVAVSATAPADRYPNRARALQAASLLDHDPRDLDTVLAVVLPPGTADPAPRAWMSWVDRAREERLAAEAPKRPRQRRTP